MNNDNQFLHKLFRKILEFKNSKIDYSVLIHISEIV